LCALGRINLLDDEEVRLNIAFLSGKGGNEYCAAGKDSLAALDELAGLVPSQSTKSIALSVMSFFKLFNSLSIRSTYFSVLLSLECVSPSQVRTLGYYGKYGNFHSPESVIAMTKAVNILYKITITDVKELLDSSQIDPETRIKIKDAFRRNAEYDNFVGLIKHLYKKASRLSERKEPDEELKETVDDIACFLTFLENGQGDDIKWAFEELNKEREMDKLIQEYWI